MNDPLPPLSDEDLSAVIDGEAGPGLLARVEADPRAQARLVTLRRAIAGLQGDPVIPLDQATVDQLIARALAPAAAEVTALPPRASRRTPPSWLVAAAVVACMAIGLGLVLSDRSNSGTTTIAASDQKSSGSADLESEAGAPSGPHDLATTVSGNGYEAAIDTVELGSFATDDALRNALKEQFPGQNTATTGSASAPGSLTDLQVTRCQTQVQNVLSITAEPTHVGQALVAGAAVLVYEFPASSITGSTPVPIVAAVTVETCAQVFTFQR